jgi:hypothetical protein
MLNLLNRLKNKVYIKQLQANFDFHITSSYNKDVDNLLARLCDEHGSDKGTLRLDGHPYPWPAHTKTDYYSYLFSHCRDAVQRVFECGLGTNNPNLPSSMGVSGRPGASLRVWRDYFPNAEVFGADIDADIQFTEDRIKTFFINQLDPKSIHAFWEEVDENEFDFMLDDGLHTFEAGSTLFVHSISKMKNSGIYIIEDVVPWDLLLYKEFFADKGFLVEFVNLYRPNTPLSDNSLVVVRNKVQSHL